VATVGAPADVSHVRHLFDNDVETIRAEGQAIGLNALVDP
jgi:hypothetical protein